MLNSVVLYTQRHWRYIHSHLFQPLLKTEMNKSVIEVVAKVAEQCVRDCTCIEILCSCCNSSVSWSDCMVPLVDVLIARVMNKVKLNARDRDEVYMKLVAGLEANCNKLEKSVRFSKLLFNVVKYMPHEIRMRYQPRLVDVCKSNQLFLAKRALTVLQSSVN